MSQLASLIVLALVAFAVIALGWWLLIASEGVYLGRRVRGSTTRLGRMKSLPLVESGWLY